MAQQQRKLTIMVSSTVYGIEELLDRIYTLLTAYGYEVWMSHKGTLPVHSGLTAFDNCLRAVDESDLFLGIITTSYGSGQNPADNKSRSITHQEILKAIELNKPRWLLAHDHVVFARTLLTNLGFKGKSGRQSLKLQKNTIFGDLRILDLYEEATIDHESPDDVPLAERRGNWVQKFRTHEEGSLFVNAQFGRYQEVEAFLQENFERGFSLLKKGGNA
uniref:DUF4062 domain-containing protein n=1 Tax=Chlorobium chlorochromatii (strain CaD3) TaxID=340177 RepID=Q3APE1_CHLCH